MSTFNLELPDGRVIEGIPEGTTKAEIMAKLGMQNDPGAGKPTLGSEALAVADKAVRGGLGGIPNTIAQLGEANRKQAASDTGVTGFTPASLLLKAMPDTSELAATLNTALTPTKPQTEAGKYLGAAAEGAVGGMLPMGQGANFVKNALTGAGAGAGSEGAAHLLGDNALSRILGGLAGGLTFGGLTGSVTNRAELARKVLGDVDEKDLQLAKGVMEDTAARGTPLDLSQSMSKASNIDKMRDILANSAEGKGVIRLLREQPAQAEAAAEKYLRGTPGQVLPKQVVANEAQEGAAQRIKDLYALASKEWEKRAPQGATIPQNGMRAFDQQLAAMQKKYLPDAPGYQMIADIRQTIMKDAGQAAPTTKPGLFELLGGAPSAKPAGTPATYHDDALKLKDAIDSSLSSFGARRLNTDNVDRKLQRQAQEIREAFSKDGGLIDTYVPALREANKAFEGVMRNAVEPAKKSVTGRLAQPAGPLNDREAITGKLFNVFEAGTDPNATGSEIRTLARDLNKAGSGESFVNGVKTWLSDKLSTATREVGGRSDDTMAGAAVTSMFKDAKQKQGFRDMLSGVAEIQGLPKAELVSGAERFFDYLGRVSRRPSNPSGMSAEDARRASETSLFGRFGQFSVITPFRQPILHYLDFLRKDAYSAMDKMLSTPEGVDMLIKFSHNPAMSPAAQKALATFTGTLNTVQDGSNSPGITPE